MNIENMFGGGAVTAKATAPQSNAQSSTTATPTKATSGGVVNPAFPWLAWVGMLVAVRIISDKYGK